MVGAARAPTAENERRISMHLLLIGLLIGYIAHDLIDMLKKKLAKKVEEM